jgi:peroxiredoxin
MIEKLLLPFDLLSDPTGAAISQYGFWNDREGTALPAIVVVDRDGGVRYVYEGRDFADRPGDEVVLDAISRQAGERS